MRVEIREDSVLLDGYVNAVNRDSRILMDCEGRFVEQITAGTWQRALESTKNVDLLFNHDKERKLGSTTTGNLELYEDNIGLRAKCVVSDEEVVSKAKEGKLTGWSFGFICTKARKEPVDNMNRRYIEELRLLEVSILDKTPAYYGTSIETRGEEIEITCLRSEDDAQVNSIVADSETSCEENNAAQEPPLNETLDYEY